MTNREILFIVRLRNEARAALNALGIDLRKVAADARKVAQSLGLAAPSITATGTAATQASAKLDGYTKSVTAAGMAMWRSNAHAGGFFGTLQTGIKHVLGFTTAALAMEGALTGVHKYFEDVTDYQNLLGKVALVTNGEDRQRAVMGRLGAVSLASHQSIDDIGDSYFKAKFSLGRFGYSDQQAIDLAQIVAQGNLISHNTPQQAKWGSYELFQGIGAGQLNGRELRYIAQDSIALSKALADGINKAHPEIAQKFGFAIKDGAQKGLKEIAPGQLMELAKHHLLTGSMVADALLSQKAQIAAEAAKVPLTLPRVKQDLHTSAVMGLGAFDAQNGISEGVVKALDGFAVKGLPAMLSALQPVADTLKTIAALVRGAFGLFQGYIQGILTVLPGLGTTVAMVAKGVGLFALSFGLLSVASAGVTVALEFVKKGVLAVNAAMDANPVGAVIVALSALIAVYELVKDKTVQVAGHTASVGNLVGVYWERTVKFVSSIWADFVPVMATILRSVWNVAKTVCETIDGAWKWLMGQVGNAALGIGQKMGGVFSGLVSWLVGIVNTGFKLVGDFWGGALDLLGNGVGLFNQDLAAKLHGAAGIVRSTMANLPAEMAAKGLAAAKAVGDAFGSTTGYIKGKVHAAYDGALQEAETRTKNGKKLHNTYDLSKLGEGEEHLDPNSGPEKDKTKKGPDLIAKAEAALKALTAAYNPFLAQVDKAGEAQTKLDFLLKLQTEDAKKFGTALDNAGLNLAQFKELAWDVAHKLDAKSVTDFFSAYVLGYKASTDADKKAAETAAIAKNLIDARTEAYREGGKALEYYNNLLRQNGVEDKDVLSAEENYKNGVSNQGLADLTANIKKAVQAYFPLLKAKRTDAEADEALNEIGRARTQSLDLYNEALKKAGLTEADYQRLLLQRKVAAGTATVWETAKAEADKFVTAIRTNGITIKDIFANAFKGAEDVLVNFVTSGKLKIKDLVDSAIADLARLAIQQLEVRAFSSIFGIPIPTAHIGGIAGQAQAGAKMAGPAMFAGARRFHSGGIPGLKGGEVPIIAKEDEAIMPTVRLPDGNFGVRASLPKSKRGGGDAPVLNFAPVLHISVPSGEDPQRHADALTKTLIPALKGLVQEQFVDQLRPGGILHSAMG